MDACEHVQSMTQENRSKFTFTRIARYSEAMSSMCDEKLIYCDRDSCVLIMSKTRCITQVNRIARSTK